MYLNEKYPELANFIGSWFPDSDLDRKSDEETAVEFGLIHLENTKTVIAQGRALLKEPNFPWQDISKEANRYFVTVSQAKEWLERVIDVLDRVNTNRK